LEAENVVIQREAYTSDDSERLVGQAEKLVPKRIKSLNNDRTEKKESLCGIL